MITVDIYYAVKREKNKFVSIGRKYHPDKTNDENLHEKFKNAQYKYQMSQRAHNFLGIADCNGTYYKRV